MTTLDIRDITTYNLPVYIVFIVHLCVVNSLLKKIPYHILSYTNSRANIILGLY